MRGNTDWVQPLRTHTSTIKRERGDQLLNTGHDPKCTGGLIHASGGVCVQPQTSEVHRPPLAMQPSPAGTPGCEDGWEALVLPPSDDDLICESDTTGPPDGGYTVVTHSKAGAASNAGAEQESLEGASGWYASPPDGLYTTQPRAVILGAVSSEQCCPSMSRGSVAERQHAGRAALTTSGTDCEPSGQIGGVETDTFISYSQADQGRIQQHAGHMALMARGQKQKPQVESAAAAFASPRSMQRGCTDAGPQPEPHVSGCPFFAWDPPPQGRRVYLHVGPCFKARNHHRLGTIHMRLACLHWAPCPRPHPTPHRLPLASAAAPVSTYQYGCARQRFGCRYSCMLAPECSSTCNWAITLCCRRLMGSPHARLSRMALIARLRGAAQQVVILMKGQRPKRRGALNWLLLLPAGVACMAAMARVLRSNVSGGSRSALA